MRRLIEEYWRPVYWVVRHKWAKSDEDAKDLTQEFFASTLIERPLVRAFVRERGSFRAFLRAALTNFLRDVHKTARRQKRGGAAIVISFDAKQDLRDLPDLATLSPEAAFDAAWRRLLLGRALGMLERRLEAEGKRVAFDVLRRYDLEGADVEYGDVARDTGLTVLQVKRALAYAREALREVVTDLVCGYVDSPATLAEELRHVFGEDEPQR